MANPLQKFIIRNFAKVLAGIIVGVAVVSAGGTFALNLVGPQAAARLNLLLPDLDLRAGKFAYIFPDRIYLRRSDFNFVSPRKPAGRKISLPLIVLKLSIPELIIGHRLFLREAVLVKPRIPVEETNCWLTRNQEGITRLLQTMPRRDFLLQVRQGVAADRQDILENTFSLNLRLKKNFFTGVLTLAPINSVYLKSPSALILPKHPRLSLQSKIQGFLTENGALINSWEIFHECFYLKTWGELSGKKLTVNGFAFLNLLNPMPLENRQQFAPPYRPKRLEAGTNPDTIYLLDLQGQAFVDWEGIKITAADFTINKFPVQLKGMVTFRPVVQVLLDWQSSLPPRHKLRGSFVNTKGRLLLERIGGELLADGQLDFLLPPGTTAFKTYERSRFAVTRARFAARASRSYAFHVESLRLSLFSAEGEEAWALTDFNGQLNLEDRDLKLFEITAPFGGGKIRNRLWLKNNGRKITALLEAEDIAAESLKDAAPFLRKIDARINARVVLQNRADWIIGKLWWGQGFIQDLEFFDWLAETFALPAVKRIQTESARAEIAAEDGNIGLRDILIKSPQADIRGFYFQKPGDLITSKLTLIFPREILRQSPKLSALLRDSPETEREFRFDFQLSGRPSAMNFIWQNSELKQRIQKLIPDFIEKRIERSVENTLEPK